MINCDCNERVGVEINSWQQFKELKYFFEKQVDDKIFSDLTDYDGVWYLDGGNETSIYRNTIKTYRCDVCGCLWEFIYPDFPAKGLVRKFPDVKYSEKPQL